MGLKKAGSEGGSSSEWRISALVVDDNATIRFLHKTILKGLCNMEPKIAKDGKEAVDMCRSGENFDIILMDKQMPIMNGVEATRKLREMGVKSKIVGVTILDNESEKEEFLAAGLDLYLEKPLNPTMLRDVLKELQLI
ncbi:hypothetical protein RJT34_20651 [Clitoria ternatea]|uniref:Response regulatory domain-containing protein n=1 Tax=Clitoria ternatea TaxID=43366 RepID=A0AAN9ITV5_CLITE